MHPPPDLFDGDGNRLPDRRDPASPRADIDAGYERWVVLMMMHRGKLVAVAGALGTIVTFLATTAAMRVIALDRLARVERNDFDQDTAIAALRHRAELTAYDVATNKFLLCLTAAKLDPKRSAEKCEDILNPKP